MRYSIILLLILSFCNLLASDKDKYLEAYWDFETINAYNELVDLSHHHHDGTINGNPAIVDGKVGKCFKFSGVEDITLPDSNFLADQCNISMTCWFNIQGPINDRYQLFCISGSEPFYDPCTFQFWNAKPYDFGFEDTKSGKYVIRSNSDNFHYKLEQNQWYFLTVTLCNDGNYSTMKIYIDGWLIEVVTTLSDMQTYQPYSPGKLCPNYKHPMPASIGSVPNYSPWHWIGMIDEMKFYTTCLSDDEITEDYAEQCKSNYYLYSSASCFKDASKRDNYLQLNYENQNSNGAVWTEQCPVSDGFETDFSFDVNSYSAQLKGDGFAFVIQNSSKQAIGNGYSGLGYDGIANGLAFEFDVNSDQNKHDPNTQHVAVQAATNGYLSSDHSIGNLAISTAHFAIVSNVKYFVKIIYNKNYKTLKLYLSQNTPIDTNKPLITISNFNLQDYINLSNGKAYIGFTCASGNSAEQYNIKNWTYCPNILIANQCNSDAKFDYSNFTSTAALNYVNSILEPQQYVRLTTGDYNQKAAVWKNNYVPLANGFSTEFSFRTSEGVAGDMPEASATGADGFAFVIQNQGLNICGNRGGGIAYDGLENALAVEIDLFCNDTAQIENYNDPNGNHIAVQVAKGGKLSAIHNNVNTLAMTTAIPVIKNDASIYYCKIVYDKNVEQLKVYISDSQNYYSPNLVIDNFNLSDYVNLYKNGYGYIGITAATGDSYQKQDLLSWNFCPNDVDSTAGNFTGINNNNNISYESDKIVPNPVVNDNAEIIFNSDQEAPYELNVYDVLGNKILTKYLGVCAYGTNKINLNCKSFDKGIYLVNLKSIISIKTFKMIVQ